MASDGTPAAPPPCAPCRGTGRVISNLGGTPSTVICPWCDGTGITISGRDAQAGPPAVAESD